MNLRAPHYLRSISVLIALALAVGCAEPRSRPPVDHTTHASTQAHDAAAPPAMDASAPTRWGHLSLEELPPLPGSGVGICCDPSHYDQCLQFHRNSLHTQGVRPDRAERLARFMCGRNCPLRRLDSPNRDASCADLPDVPRPW